MHGVGIGLAHGFPEDETGEGVARIRVGVDVPRLGEQVVRRPGADEGAERFVVLWTGKRTLIAQAGRVTEELVQRQTANLRVEAFRVPRDGAVEIDLPLLFQGSERRRR